MEDLLQQGIKEFKSGQRDEARRSFATFIKQNPNNDQAWGWMSQVCYTDQERIHCLKQVLRINPHNEKTRQYLDKLLAAQSASELHLSPIESVPLSPARPEQKAQHKRTSFTPSQVLILLGLMVTMLFLFGFVMVDMLQDRETVVVAASSTHVVVSPVTNTPLPTQVLTATLIPTYAYAPTWTPLPSPTAFVITAIPPATSKPQQAQSNSAPVNPPAENSSSNCSAQLEYAASMNQYYLDQIDYIHAPLIQLLERWIDEAAGDRDAVSLVQWQQELENEKAQVKAEKASENQRYQAEAAKIKANCQ